MVMLGHATLHRTHPIQQKPTTNSRLPLNTAIKAVPLQILQHLRTRIARRKVHHEGGTLDEENPRDIDPVQVQTLLLPGDYYVGVANTHDDGTGACGSIIAGSDICWVLRADAGVRDAWLWLSWIASAVKRERDEEEGGMYCQ